MPEVAAVEMFDMNVQFKMKFSTFEVSSGRFSISFKFHLNSFSNRHGARYEPPGGGRGGLSKTGNNKVVLMDRNVFENCFPGQDL